MIGSLFSGIGGLDLGLERAGMTVAWQCEIDKDGALNAVKLNYNAISTGLGFGRIQANPSHGGRS